MRATRVKQEERLRSVAAQREGLDGRVHSQELAAEQRLDALDAALQACAFTQSHDPCSFF